MSSPEGETARQTDQQAAQSLQTIKGGRVIYVEPAFPEAVIVEVGGVQQVYRPADAQEGGEGTS